MNRFILLFLAISITLATPAHATRTVTSPYVDEGVLKLKWKGGATHDDESESSDGALASKFAAEYGVAENVSLELETDIEKSGNEDDVESTATSLKAKVQITEKGAYWLDAGARLSYELNHAGGPDSAEFKFILAKDTENSRHVANFIIDGEVGDDAEDDVNTGLSWSSRYKWVSEFEPGFEIFNNFGGLSEGADYDDQDHSIGPVAYGKLSDNIKYEAGYLVGFSDSTADGRFKAVLEYAIKF